MGIHGLRHGRRPVSYLKGPGQSRLFREKNAVHKLLLARPAQEAPSWAQGVKGLTVLGNGRPGYARAKRPGAVLRKRARSFLVRISRTMAA
jgi:hypothetical protein